MKKFFLSIDQRDRIVSALTMKIDGLKKMGTDTSAVIRDVIDADIQNTDMLVELLVVKENERL